MKSLKNDGSSSEIGLRTREATATDLSDITDSFSVVNGTFSTLDEVAPVVAITTPATVSQTFAVTGTVTDVGGMGTASATLTGLTSGATQTVALPLTPTSASTWTFTKDVNWASYEIVNISVTATDAAGKIGSNNALVTVSPVGFSGQSPTGYINAQPSEIHVFAQQMNKSTVAMTLSGPATIPLGVTFGAGENYYVRNTSVPALADGVWTVTATGNDTTGTPRPYPWTFTLDTAAPVINSFTIADIKGGGDGDGYIEAGETHGT
jgi:hypothetical protein